MTKINFKIILVQFIGCIFLIQGIQNLYFATQTEKFYCYIEYFKNPSIALDFDDVMKDLENDL